MKIKHLAVLTIGFTSCWIRADSPVGAATNAPSPFKDDGEKVSYAVGMSIGLSFKRQEIEVDMDKLMQGLRDVVMSNQTLLSEKQMSEVMMEAQRKAQARIAEKQKLLSDAFLAENRTKPGVVTLPSGLQYKVLTEGAGPKPGSNDMVTMHYRGTLIDGTEFAGSYKHGQPVTFPLRSGGPLRGWAVEALQLMKVGSKWELYVPPDLTHGEFRPGVPPNSVRIFQVELITNSPSPEPAPAPGAPVTSDIIKVPSLEEMKRGSNIETIKAEDVGKEVKKQEAQKAGK
jgi:FKBP-type peptidyl-prolyl cis-trans isomerase FklB